jgi:transposase-like protein
MTNPQDNEEITLAKLALEYSDELKARVLLESWVWPDGAVCPHCKGVKAWRLEARAGSKVKVRDGVYKCGGCLKQFSVTVGTIFERTHVPLSKWMMSVFILCSSKKGVSAAQLGRMIGVTYKTAWFIFHRLRHGMEQGPLAEKLKGTVEADDVYVGGTPEKGTGTSGRGTKHKTPVVALVERGGNVRAKVVAGVSHRNLRQFVGEVLDSQAVVNTDQWNGYKPLFRPFKHEVVKHSAGEFSRVGADGSSVHVNTCESFFSLLKRGMVGAFHHVSKEHLPRYLNEFEFRWDRRKMSDGERSKELVRACVGKRLTYRNTVKPKEEK